jgi:hypothetical protein
MSQHSIVRREEAVFNPFIMGFLAHFIVCSLLLNTAYADEDLATVTIDSAAGYDSLRPCVQSCLLNGCNAGYADLGCNLGCGLDLGPTYLDSCYCRSDMIRSATEWISECATGGCVMNPGPDATSAVSVYTEYCKIEIPTTTEEDSTITLDDDDTSEPTPTSTDGDEGGGENSEGGEATVFSTVVITQNPDPPTTTAEADGGGGDRESSPNRSDIIAIVMGILAAVATISAAFVGRHLIVKVIRDHSFGRNHNNSHTLPNERK